MRDQWWHTCSNCEGEGQVTRWGLNGQEVPASRATRYPKDRPLHAEPGDGEPRQCDECQGHGGWTYDDKGARVYADA